MLNMNQESRYILIEKINLRGRMEMEMKRKIRKLDHRV